MWMWTLHDRHFAVCTSCVVPKWTDFPPFNCVNINAFYHSLCFCSRVTECENHGVRLVLRIWIEVTTPASWGEIPPKPGVIWVYVAYCFRRRRKKKNEKNPNEMLKICLFGVAQIVQRIKKSYKIVFHPVSEIRLIRQIKSVNQTPWCESSTIILFVGIIYAMCNLLSDLSNYSLTR